jgi:hypothetical protein
VLLETREGTASVAGLLSGAAALAPRIGGRLGTHFEHLVRRLSSPSWEPCCLPPDLYRRTRTGFELTVGRDHAWTTARRAPVQRERPRGPVRELDDVRISDLVGSLVFDADGEPVDGVGEVRLLAHGPAIDAVAVPITVDGLLVGLGTFGDRLGYAHPGGPTRPFPLDRLFRAGKRRARFVPWAAVAALEPRAIRLGIRAADLRGLHEASS